MEYCKNCLTPIISDVEDQIYCSNQCWISSRQTKSDGRWPAWRVWGYIVGIFALLLYY